MQFEVPQFIEIEDKIVGPLTWRQFLYLGGGGAMAAVLFLIAPFIIFVLIGLPLGVVAGALAFYPINNRPFSYFLEAIYNYLRREKLYLWRQQRDIIHKQDSVSTSTINNPYLAKNPSAPKKDISALARRLELQALQKK